MKKVILCGVILISIAMIGILVFSNNNKETDSNGMNQGGSVGFHQYRMRNK